MKREHDIVAMLMADIASPGVVSEINRAIEDNEQERQELLELRKMAVRRHGEAPVAEAASAPDGRVALDLTMAELVDQYRTHPESGYHQIRFKTRENYNGLLRRLERDIGPKKVADFDTERLQQQFEDWSGNGERIPMARSLLAILRILATFGVTVLKSRECRELKLTLHDMRFERAAQGSGARPTEDQVKNIIIAAHEEGLRSIALGQALQFYCSLKQKDVIGEWTPSDEPDPEGIPVFEDTHLGMNWSRGIIWEEIDDDWVLRHKASASGEELERRLQDFPAVVDELEKFIQPDGKLPKTGPVIVYEKSGRPYLTHQWRRTWREIATAAGVPKNVMNRDSAG